MCDSAANPDSAAKVQAYVADLRTNADPIWQHRHSELSKHCKSFLKAPPLPKQENLEQLLNVPDDVIFQDARLLAAETRASKAEQRLKVVEGKVHSSGSYWKEWADTVERTCKTQVEKAKQDAMTWEEAAHAAEHRAAELENLDCFIEEVLGVHRSRPQDQHPSQARADCSFSILLQSIRTALDRSFTLLAEKHAQELSEAGSVGSGSKSDLRSIAMAELPVRVPAKIEEGGVPPQPSRGSSKDRPVEELRVYPIWKDVPADAQQSVRRIEMLGDGGDAHQMNTCSKWVASSSSSLSLAWFLLGMLIVAYDVVLSPLYLFKLPASEILAGIRWAKSIFWALDIVRAMKYGYVREAFHRTTSSKLLMASRLVFDLALLAFDLVLASVSPLSMWGIRLEIDWLQEESVLQWLRFMLLLRLVNVHHQLSGMEWRIQSPEFCIVLSVAEAVALICIIIHVVACGFYALVLGKLPESVLVERYIFWGEEVHVRYFVSLCWALDRFTWSSYEVPPASYTECVYVVMITFVASIMVCILFCKFMSAVVQLGHLHRDWQGQVAALRKYLQQRSAPPSLRQRIWDSLSLFDRGPAASGRLLHEHDVALLGCVPHKFRHELREVVSAPTLGAHPFINRFRCLPQLYACVEEIFVRSGICIFRTGKAAQHMQFVVHGEFSYRFEPLGQNPATRLRESGEVTTGPWFSEPAMWIRWSHRGQMIAVSNCELLCIQAKRFQETLEHEVPDLAVQCRRYAKRFARYAQDSWQHLSDVHIDMRRLRELAASADFGT